MISQLDKARENWVNDILREVTAHREANGLQWDDPVGVDIPKHVVPLLGPAELQILKIKHITVTEAKK